MDQEVVMLGWTSVFGLGCAFAALGILTIVIVAGVLIARRSTANPYELAELRKENERLRQEVERLKQGHSTTGSTDIKA